MTTSRDNERIIHPESLNRGTANRRQPNDVHPILTPAEMLMPSVGARIEERNRFAGIWRWHVNSVRLVQIAARTGPGEVLKFRLPAPAARKNVLDVKGGALQGLVHSTVLASSGGTLLHPTSDLAPKSHAGLRPSK